MSSEVTYKWVDVEEKAEEDELKCPTESKNRKNNNNVIAHENRIRVNWLTSISSCLRSINFSQCDKISSALFSMPPPIPLNTRLPARLLQILSHGSLGGSGCLYEATQAYAFSLPQAEHPQQWEQHVLMDCGVVDGQSDRQSDRRLPGHTADPPPPLR